MNRLIEAGQLDRLKVTEGDCTLTSQPQSKQAKGVTVTKVRLHDRESGN